MISAWGPFPDIVIILVLDLLYHSTVPSFCPVLSKNQSSVLWAKSDLFLSFFNTPQKEHSLIETLMTLSAIDTSSTCFLANPMCLEYSEIRSVCCFVRSAEAIVWPASTESKIKIAIVICTILFFILGIPDNWDQFRHWFFSLPVPL